MALACSRLLQVLNGSIGFLALALVGIAPTVMYLTSHSMHWMNYVWPQGRYQWYRPLEKRMNLDSQWANAPSLYPYATLTYESANEGLIVAAAVVSLCAGLFGLVGAFLSRKVSYTLGLTRSTSESSSQNGEPSNLESTLFGQILPGAVAAIATYKAFVYAQVINDTDNRGQCIWTDNYYSHTRLKCTREQAACNIVGHFILDETDLGAEAISDAQRGICEETQTGKQLVAALCAVSLLMCGLAVGRFFIERKELRRLERADFENERSEKQDEKEAIR